MWRWREWEFTVNIEKATREEKKNRWEIRQINYIRSSSYVFLCVCCNSQSEKSKQMPYEKVNTKMCGKQKLPVTILPCAYARDSEIQTWNEQWKKKQCETIMIRHEKSAQVYPSIFQSYQLIPSPSSSSSSFVCFLVYVLVCSLFLLASFFFSFRCYFIAFVSSSRAIAHMKTHTYLFTLFKPTTLFSFIMWIYSKSINQNLS